MGDRNNRLNRAAFSLGMLVAGGELDRALVEEELLAAAVVTSPGSRVLASMPDTYRMPNLR